MNPRLTSLSGAISAGSFEYLRRLMLRRTGTELDAGKKYLVEARLFAVAMREGFGSPAALLEGLQTEEEWGVLHRKVAEAMLNCETSFFRDLYPFEAMREVILPELIRKRESTRTLNLWCAAASSGQEAYSIAMMLLEHFPRLAGWKIRLIASDVSESILERARAGVFGHVEVNRGLPARLLVRFFERVDTQWRIAEQPRRMIEFQQINLAGAWPTLPPMDVVLLRNVLLYFGPETRGTVLRKVSQLLKADGYLFMGGGETSLYSDRSFESVRIGKATCFRPCG